MEAYQKYLGKRIVACVKEAMKSEDYNRIYEQKNISCNELVEVLEYTIYLVKNDVPLRLD